MSKVMKIAISIIIVGVLASIIMFYLGVTKKIDYSNPQFEFKFNCIFFIATVLETIMFIHFTIKEKIIYLKQGKIIYQFSKLDDKNNIISIILFTIIIAFNIVELKNKPSIILICVLWIVLIVLLMKVITVFTKKGISKIGIDAVQWDQIEYIQLCKSNKIISYRLKGSKRCYSNKIVNNVCDDNIEKFLKDYCNNLKIEFM